jgi:hypothetical protein
LVVEGVVVGDGEVTAQAGHIATLVGQPGNDTERPEVAAVVLPGSSKISPQLKTDKYKSRNHRNQMLLSYLVDFVHLY